MSAMSNTRMRLERLADERARTQEKIEDAISVAESEERPLAEFEEQQLDKHRTRLDELEGEIAVLAADLERAEKSVDVSKLIRVTEPPPSVRTTQTETAPVVYRTFAAYARDLMIMQFPRIASAVNGVENAARIRDDATERLQRVEHTLTSDVEGLLPPTHMAQIMDIINGSRPVVSTARRVDLSSGRLTYPKIAQRPEVLKQTAEKTEAGTANMQVTLEDITADTYLGGGNLSWQTINWSTPSALQLWFDLAAEAYARQTETAACTDLSTSAVGTVTTPLGTSGTESFAQWRAAAIAGISTIYTSTGGRARTNTLYLAAGRFFQLAGLGTDQTLQVSPVGNLNVETLTGTWSGLRVVGSYGFSSQMTAIVGDSAAFLVGETPGAPVEMRAVEPAIGGMEVGVIGAFKSKVFDAARFRRLS